MATFLDIALKFRAIAEAINATREEESVRIANDLGALVRRRVQTDKEDSDGSGFGGYSQAVVPQPFYWGKSLSQGAEDAVKAGGWFLSYETFRELNNQPTDAKNYTFTGEMWRDTGITFVENTTTTTEVRIGGQTTRAAELLAFNSSRDGVNLLSASDEEIEFVREAHTERIVNIINEFIG